MVTFDNHTPKSFDVSRNGWWIGTVYYGPEGESEFAFAPDEAGKIKIEEMRQIVSHFDELKAKKG